MSSSRERLELVTAHESKQAAGEVDHTKRTTKVARRIARRALRQIGKGNHAFVVKGGKLGRAATQHPPGVYRAVANRLEEKGVGVKADRASWEESDLGAPIVFHKGDVITVTSVNGEDVNLPEHPIIASGNYKIRRLYPNVNSIPKTDLRTNITAHHG
jgi:hypothetical protein